MGRLLVMGGGYTGQRLATRAREAGVHTLLTSRKPQLSKPDTTWLQFDSRNGITPEGSDLEGVSHVLVSIPPDDQGGDPVLRHLGSVLRSLPLSWVGYLPTTGVYGDTGGAWVDETAPTPASAKRSRARLEAERAWLESGLPVQIFRLPAIYGPGRTPFRSLQAGESRLIHKPGQVFSRVHVEDIAGTLLHCWSLPEGDRPQLLNVADNYPCSSSETLSYAAHLLGCKLPTVERFDCVEASMSPMARSFWMENRRVSNRRLCRQLGYQLKYPTFQKGYLENSLMYGEPSG